MSSSGPKKPIERANARLAADPSGSAANSDSRSSSTMRVIVSTSTSSTSGRSRKSRRRPLDEHNRFVDKGVELGLLISGGLRCSWLDRIGASSMPRPSGRGCGQISEPVVIEQADDRLHGERKHDCRGDDENLRRNQSEKRLTSASAAAGSVSEFGRSLTASLPPGQPDGLPRRPPGQTPTRVSSEPLDRPAHRDRCDNRPVAVVHRSTHRGNARLAFFDRGDPCPAVGAEQDPAARPLIERQDRAGGNDRAQPVRRLQGGETDAGITLPHEKLRRFAGGVTKRREGGRAASASGHPAAAASPSVTSRGPVRSGRRDYDAAGHGLRVPRRGGGQWPDSDRCVRRVR